MLNDPLVGTVTITGTAAENAALTANVAISDGDGLGTLHYQWLRNGVTPIGANQNTYVPVDADVGATISVQVSYTDGNGTPESITSAATAAIENVNDVPTGTVTITGDAIEDQTLTASNTLADEDGLGAITYQWRRDGVDIAGATNSSYTLGDADVEAEITVVAKYTDGHGTPETVSSAATNEVQNVNDDPTGTVTISGTATENQVLTASNTLADDDGIGPVTYQWRRGGVDIAGATGTTYTLVDADVGAQMTVVAKYTDGHGTLETITSAQTAAVINVNDAPTGTVTITGTATENQVLTASNTLADEDGLGVVTYQWKRGGVDIVGATNSTYTLVDADVGAQITVAAKYTDGRGTLETVSSAATTAVINVNDAPTGTVTINGTATEDQTLTVSNTLADEDGLGPITYQWRRGGVDIAGATGTSYTLGDLDVNQNITVVAKYTDGRGALETVISDPKGPVININDAPVADPGAATGDRNEPLTGQAHADDVDNTPAQLTYGLVGVDGGALHGTVSMATDGTYTYTPDAGFVGDDSFQFRANDGFANSNIATILVSIVSSGLPENDFNGDRNADVLLQNNNGALAVWTMNGLTPTAQAQVPLNPGPTWHAIGSGDFDGDGKSEVLWQNDNGLPAIWTMNGTNFVSAAALANPGPTWHIQEIADFNDDGKSDLLWRNDNGTPAIWLMDGPNMTSAALLPNPGATWKIEATGDFNGDDKADILWQNDNGLPAIWLMDGLVRTGAVALPNPGPTWDIKAASDFDGDGKTDILWQNDSSGLPAIWFMDGVNFASAAALDNPGTTWDIFEAFDMDADGDADIQWQNDNGTVAVWLMDGATRTDAAAFAPPSVGWHLI